MSRPTNWAAAAAVSVVVAAVFYVLPTFIELQVLPRLGAFATIVCLGDLLGCAVLFAMNWKRALGLLLLLDGFETVALQSNTISPYYVIVFTNLVPAILVAVVVARFAVDVVLVMETPEGARL